MILLQGQTLASHGSYCSNVMFGMCPAHSVVTTMETLMMMMTLTTW